MAKADRTGNRIPRSAFKKRIPDLGRYFIYTDADETEEKYMYGLRDSLPKEFQGRIVIKVSKTKTEKLIEACKEQVSLQPQYCEPWIVFDRDEVPNFDKIISDAERCGIHVGWSNPCIEICCGVNKKSLRSSPLWEWNKRPSADFSLQKLL